MPKGNTVDVHMPTNDGPEAPSVARHELSGTLSGSQASGDVIFCVLPVCCFGRVFGQSWHRTPLNGSGGDALANVQVQVRRSAKVQEDAVQYRHLLVQFLDHHCRVVRVHVHECLRGLPMDAPQQAIHHDHKKKWGQWAALTNAPGELHNLASLPFKSGVAAVPYLKRASQVPHTRG
jgi:hypothetical protein